MVRFLKIAVFALAAVVLLGFAFANHHFATVSFDPFASVDNAALSIDAPLFAIAIVAAMFGVVAGAFATWLSQGRHRRASRQSRLEADKWRAQAEALKAAQPRDAASRLAAGPLSGGAGRWRSAGRRRQSIRASSQRVRDSPGWAGTAYSGLATVCRARSRASPGVTP